MNTIEYRVDCQLLAHVRSDPNTGKRRGSAVSRERLLRSLFFRCSPAFQLHWENALGCRFPIGQMSQISGWPLAALRSFHSRHYFPANATLYLVGDVDPTAALAAISAAFDHIPPSPPPVGFGAAAAAAAAAHAAAVRAGTLPPRVRSPHRPPVVHAYGAPPPPPPPPPAAAAAAPFRLPAPVPGRLVESEGAPRLFAHELLTQFSLSLFCKLPVRPVRTASALAACFAQRVALSVLQARLGRALSSGLARYQTADLDHSDSGREGCAVSTFTVTSEPGDWRAAVAGACAVARRLARRGATPAEFARYKAALLRDSEQLAAQAGTVPSADNLDFVMESDALGHAVMDQLQGHAALAACGEKGVTLEDVNDACVRRCSGRGRPLALGSPWPRASLPLFLSFFFSSFISFTRDRCAELLGYIADYGLPLLAQPGGGPGGAPGAGGARDPRGGVATAVVVCVPAFLPAGEDDDDDGTTAAKGAPPSPPTPFAITADEVAAALRDHGGPDGGGGAEAVAPLRLVAASDLDARVAALSPHYVPLDGVTPPPFPGWAPPPPPPSGAGTVALRRLSNGATVAWLRSANEPAGASLRLSSSAGGRASEPAAPGPAGVGALALGARALSEVGGCLSHSREELELFAMDRLLTFSVDAGDDSLQLDAHVAVGGGDGGAEGLTAALELLCGMASAPTLDDAAFERARALLSAHVRAAPKSLERATRAAAVRAGLGDDRRFGDPSESDVAALTRPGVLAALAAALGDPARL